MTSPATLGADDLRAVMGGYRDALRLHQVDINRLNVYPVPDGDTGTNMALTLEAVVSELDGVGAGAGLLEVCKAIGHASELARRAVVRPVEGTILTVAAAAAGGATHGAGLVGVVESARAE